MDLLLFPLRFAAWLAQPLAAPLWRRSARRAIVCALASRSLVADGPIEVELRWSKRVARIAQARVAVRRVDGGCPRHSAVEVRLASEPTLVPRWELESFGLTA